MTTEEINNTLKKCDKYSPLRIWVNTGSCTNIFQIGDSFFEDSLNFKWTGEAHYQLHTLIITSQHKFMDGTEKEDIFVTLVKNVVKIESLRMVVDSHDSK